VKVQGERIDGGSADPRREMLGVEAALEGGAMYTEPPIEVRNGGGAYFGEFPKKEIQNQKGGRSYRQFLVGGLGVLASYDVYG
jgi:hypothetical protein